MAVLCLNKMLALRRSIKAGASSTETELKPLTCNTDTLKTSKASAKPEPSEDYHLSYGFRSGEPSKTDRMVAKPEPQDDDYLGHGFPAMDSPSTSYKPAEKTPAKSPPVASSASAFEYRTPTARFVSGQTRPIEQPKKSLQSQPGPTPTARACAEAALSRYDPSYRSYGAPSSQQSGPSAIREPQNSFPDKAASTTITKPSNSPSVTTLGDSPLFEFSPTPARGTSSPSVRFLIRVPIPVFGFLVPTAGFVVLNVFLKPWKS